MTEEQEGMVEKLGEMRKGRRKRIEKGSHCIFKSSGYDKLELKHQNLFFNNINDESLKTGLHNGKAVANYSQLVPCNLLIPFISRLLEPQWQISLERQVHYCILCRQLFSYSLQ